jgi:flagellar protein FlaJ
MKKSKGKSKSVSSLGQETSTVTSGEKFNALIYRIFQKPTRWFVKEMPQLRDDILKSGMTISPEAYISLVLFSTMIAFIPTIIGIFLLVGWRMIFGLFFLPIGPLAFALGLVAAKLSQSSRAGAVDHELHFVVGYITTMAGGGISPLVTLRRLSKVDLYPAAAKEAKRILMDIDVFGMDPISAIDKASRYNPNKALSDFLGGYSSVLKTGGDVVHYMETKLRDIFNYRTMKTKNAAELIGTFAEAYIALTVILGISFFVLFAIQGLLGQGGGGNSGLSSIIIFSGVFIPIISMLFIYLVHNTQAKEPFTFFKPYFIFSGSLIIVPLFLLLPFNIPFYTKLGLGMVLSVIPAMIVNSKEGRHRSSVESMIPSFLRDMAEVRKTGLAPEKCIEQLSQRKYGGLSPYITTMSSQLTWGIPLSKVMINFSKSVRSWMTRAVAFLLLEVVDVGGGTVKMFGNLADFSQKLSEIEREKKSALRPYIFIPYFGAVMVVVTTLMMLYFITSPIGGTGASPMSMTSGVDMGLATTILLSGAILQAWIMGFVAGKMGEGSVAAGFKHAAALTIINLIAIYLTSFMFNLPL